MVKILSSRALLLLGLVVAALLLVWSGSTLASSKKVYVSPRGNDTPRHGTALSPWRTVDYALQQVQPGTTIRVAAGTYHEHVHTVRSGTATAPITLQAAGRVVIFADEGDGRLLEVDHDYYRIEGFEFSGGDTQLWLQEADNTVITKNYFHQAAGECVRIKYQSANNVFEQNRVEDCGREDFAGGGDGKNGEGVYIGTAPEQLTRNPTPDVDYSNNNIIRHNTFNTQGNECVDIKEGSEQNVVEFNNCTGQHDPDSGGMDSRGNRNIFRYNRIYGNAGAGIRLGGDTANDGLYNEAYGNVIVDNAREALKIQRPQQGVICGNTVERNQRGVSNRTDVKNSPCTWSLLPAGNNDFVNIQ